MKRKVDVLSDKRNEKKLKPKPLVHCNSKHNVKWKWKSKKRNENSVENAKANESENKSS